MKRHILFVLPLAIVLCLSGCAGRPGLPTEPQQRTHRRQQKARKLPK